MDKVNASRNFTTYDRNPIFSTAHRKCSGTLIEHKSSEKNERMDARQSGRSIDKNFVVKYVTNVFDVYIIFLIVMENVEVYK